MLTRKDACKDRPGRWIPVTAFLVALPVNMADAQNAASGPDYTYTLFGTPGLIDMPTAQSADDAELASTIAYFGGTTRTTLSFQISDRLSGSFRYSRINQERGVTEGSLYDRSFDLRYQVLQEGPNRPAIAIGLQDFVGTGVYSGEYIVASKQVLPQLTVTSGIGWGRLGSYNGFTNPLGIFDEGLEDRPIGTTGKGGEIESSRWFRGDAALFGGVAWQATDDLTLKAEYATDAYVYETNTRRNLFERASPLNFGLAYAVSDSVTAQGYYLYGSEVGAALTFAINPKEPAVFGGIDQRPTPVKPRLAGAALRRGWTAQPDAPAIIQDSVQRLLAAEGMTLEAISLEPTGVTVLIRNDSYLAGAQAIGRTARILTQVMPASVETFTIVPVAAGLRTAAVTIARSDIETLEFAPDNTAKSYARTRIDSPAAADPDATYADGLYPKFYWGLGPYISATYFDPNNPVRVDVGAELSVQYDLAPGLTFAGNLRKRIAGNRDEDPRPSDSVIRHVRSDAPLYAVEGDPAIGSLTATYQFNLAPDYYGRITAGYLETMYGGISTEVLWKPAQSRLGIGAELNYAKQRDFDQLFGFQDYDVVTGHVSGYYDFGNALHAQVDVGRYLAGDFGATFALDREFDNGWRVGAYATLTDVPFSEFGEGSFDKGLRISVPLNHFGGAPSKQVFDATIQPLARDGGARLAVSDRLYETVRGYHAADLQGNWARFWR